MDPTKRCVSTVKTRKLTKEYEGIVRQLMTYMMEDSRTIPSVLTALSRARLSSVSVTVARIYREYIFYFVKGQDFRHVGGDELISCWRKDPKE